MSMDISVEQFREDVISLFKLITKDSKVDDLMIIKDNKRIHINDGDWINPEEHKLIRPKYDSEEKLENVDEIIEIARELGLEDCVVIYFNNYECNSSGFMISLWPKLEYFITCNDYNRSILNSFNPCVQGYGKGFGCELYNNGCPGSKFINLIEEHLQTLEEISS